MKWKWPCIATAVLLSVATSSAFAGFSVVKPPSPTSPLGAAGVSPLSLGLVSTRFIGSPDAPVEKRYGFGRDVALADALKQITPAGWHAQLQENLVHQFDRQKKVSWRGGRPWVDVLDILASEQGFSVDVDWKRKRLLIGERLPSRATASLVIANAAQHATAAPPKPTPAATPVWRAAAGSTLRTTVAAWTKQAGWLVRWETADPRLNFSIVAPLEFRGTYVHAITQLIQSYAHADTPLYAGAYTDQHLLRIVTDPQLIRTTENQK